MSKAREARQLDQGVQGLKTTEDKVQSKKVDQGTIKGLSRPDQTLKGNRPQYSIDAVSGTPQIALGFLKEAMTVNHE